MSHPQYLEISLQTVFQLFSQQDAQVLTHSDILQLLSFVFSQLGFNRSADQNDLEEFLEQFQLLNQTQIQISHFGDRKYLNFNRKNNKNNINDINDLKIPVQPFIQELQSVGSTFINKDQVRRFLGQIHNIIQVPRPVQDSDVEKFISDFDKNGDGQLQVQDLKGIQSLKFAVKKCRRYD